MLPDRVSNPGPLAYESGALPIALRGPACVQAALISNRSTKYVHEEILFKKKNDFDLITAF